MQYVIGVDGGNSKTDYFLFTSTGEFVDHLREGTCSHEQLSDKFEGSYRVLKDHLTTLLQRNYLTFDDIEAAAFGLAGVDLPHQQRKLEEMISRFKIKKFVVDNDSFLGIKAALPHGYGVCSINGTGTVAGGIDPLGIRLQVGGIGDMSSDFAGGGYISRQVLKAVYNQLYRCGAPTTLTAPVFEMLGIKTKEEYVEAMLNTVYSRYNHTPYIQLVFDAAESKDEVAMALLSTVANDLAKSTAGCINDLNFENKVDVVLAGSVWVKPTSSFLRDEYVKYLSELTDKDVCLIVLQVPPATGAVLWALELAHDEVVNDEVRQKVIGRIEAEAI